MTTSNYKRLLPSEQAVTPVRSMRQTLPSISPEVQLELAQNGSVVISLFAIWLIFREARLTIQALFLAASRPIGGNQAPH